MKTTIVQLVLLVFVLTMFNACEEEIVPNVEPETIGGDITTDLTLTNRSSGVDYVFDGCIDVKGGAILTVEAGVMVEFTQNSCLTIGDASVLKAIGTANEPILFTGQQKTKGYWQGISFFSTNDVNNEMTYCTVEYAGNAKISTASDAQQGALFVGRTYDDPARVKFSHLIVQHNLNIGLTIYNTSFVDALDNCTFTDNEIPVQVYGQAVDYIDSDNDFSGNQHDRIYWVGQTTGTFMNANYSVHAIDVPYYLTTDSYKVDVGGMMTIEAGAKLIASAGLVMRVEDGGIINMNGTSTQKIIIEGDTHTPSFWDGIYSKEAGKLNMNYVEISDGGEVTFGTQAMIAQISDGELNVTNCVFSNYDIYGLSYYNDMPHNANIVSSNTCNNTAGIGCIWER